MCRMLVAIGNFNIDHLLQDFVRMAADQNERHEKNAENEFKHGDGWGMAYLENDQLKIFRSTKAVFEDDQILQFKKLKSNLVILHARKASKGTVDIHNVHPFECWLEGHHYIFFHNGTIHDEVVFDNQFTPLGTTDSERLFYFLLTNSNGQLTPAFLQSKLDRLQNFSAANFILSDGKMTYAGNWYSENPVYYGMKMLQQPGLVIVASEILPHFNSDEWNTLKNQDLVSISNEELNVHLYSSRSGFQTKQQ